MAIMNEVPRVGQLSEVIAKIKPIDADAIVLDLNTPDNHTRLAQWLELIEHNCHLFLVISRLMGDLTPLTADISHELTRSAQSILETLAASRKQLDLEQYVNVARQVLGWYDHCVAAIRSMLGTLDISLAEALCEQL